MEGRGRDCEEERESCDWTIGCALHTVILNVLGTVMVNFGASGKRRESNYSIPLPTSFFFLSLSLSPPSLSPLPYLQFLLSCLQSMLRKVGRLDPPLQF